MSKLEQHKFLVLKWQDIFDSLSKEELATLDNLIGEVEDYRLQTSRSPSPYYYVVRDDEEYADEVKALILGQTRAQQGADSCEAVAWVSPLVYGQQVTFYKPTEPEGWEDAELGTEWYCRPLVYGDTKPPANQVPEGYALVPCHATPEMLSIGKRAHKEEFLFHQDPDSNIQGIWKAMIPKAPAQPDAGAGQQGADSCEPVAYGIFYQGVFQEHAWKKSAALAIAAEDYEGLQGITVQPLYTKPPENQVPDGWHLKRAKDDVETITINRISDGAWCGGGIKGADGAHGLRYEFFDAMLSAQTDIGEGQWIPCSEQLQQAEARVAELEADNAHQRERRNAARDCIRKMGEGSAWLLRKQAEAVEAYKAELLKSLKVIFHPHIEGVFAIIDQRLRQQADDMEEEDTPQK